MIVSVYKNFATKLEDVSIIAVLNNIKAGTYQSQIDTTRYAYTTGKEEKANDLKKKLLAFTTSGTFLEKRQSTFLNAYSQIINLDFDHILSGELEILTSKINQSNFTFASFVSLK